MIECLLDAGPRFHFFLHCSSTEPKLRVTVRSSHIVHRDIEIPKTALLLIPTYSIYLVLFTIVGHEVRIVLEDKKKADAIIQAREKTVITTLTP